MRQPRWTTADLAEYEVTYLNGGEGGIRTPDTLTSMPDFESGAFNRALPALRIRKPLIANGFRGVMSGRSIIPKVIWPATSAGNLPSCPSS